ncbi:hypothetical protein DFQ28_008201 [Apophysomyces sp. BC1034]|nr:hypothetical protein DFQ30_007709 [Apophysomyces sp. BC1015]KAG0181966.1 hypothetical protein DFQ29_006363 [Apophysomyces sp. BC1021]KAG0192694.1 hypothetical protein DFQ28_008201 [Apophysomyces sp. BC1034]
MNLPAIISEPLTALLGEQCYVTLIEDLNVTDVECIKYAISKGLGFGIVLGGCIVKIPQILTILRNKSAEGLSMSSYLMETFSYAITLAYNLRQGNPFSTFGEVLFIMLQNIVIMMLILLFGRQYRAIFFTLFNFVGLLYCLCSAKVVPSWALASLYAAAIPLSLASKIPQIFSNLSNKSTGQLSVFSVINYFAGSIARVFTTMTELDDPLMLGGVVLASILNGVLVLQVFLYWGNKVELKQSKTE